MTYDPWADFDQQHEEAQKAPTSKPLPVGTYNVSLYEAEVKPFTNKTDSPYAGLKALAITLKVVDGEFEGRQIWDRFGLFPKFAATQKNPGGALNRNFFSFFEKSLGLTAEQFRAVAQKIAKGEDISGDLRPLLGKVFSIKSNISEPDDYNPEGKTGVAFFNAPTTKVASSTVTADAWTSATTTTAPAAEASTDVWGTTPAENPELAAALAATSKGF